MYTLKGRRFGKFEMPSALIEDCPADAQLIMSTVIPTRAEHMYHSDCIEYYALSNSFDVVRLGEIIPTYRCTIDKSEGIKTVKWERIGG